MVKITDLMKLIELLLKALPYLVPLLKVVLQPADDETDDTASDEPESMEDYAV